MTSMGNGKHIVVRQRWVGGREEGGKDFFRALLLLFFFFVAGGEWLLLVVNQQQYFELLRKNNMTSMDTRARTDATKGVCAAQIYSTHSSSSVWRVYLEVVTFYFDRLAG